MITFFPTLILVNVIAKDFPDRLKASREKTSS